ncbi:MAG: hypothetical protein HQL69_05935 [Magnetococcales bacterium]|nr:hypothetical protein [Magnetococcales bacterium]
MSKLFLTVEAWKKDYHPGVEDDDNDRREINFNLHEYGEKLADKIIASLKDPEISSSQTSKLNINS